ncbi:hypothetical protein ABIA39_001964 [Nocardia sp. GAS34]|uniref:hypothetical protein n=1 Tax=unclassified Nocardia TaxID=2637762 RepID=UPI003D21A152
MPTVIFTVAGGRGDSRMLDRLTGELAEDLRDIRSVAVTEVADVGITGTKSGTVLTIGQLAVSGSALTAVSLVIRDVALRFLDRTRAESITISNGEKKVVIERPSDAQVDGLVEQMRDILQDD